MTCPAPEVCAIACLMLAALAVAVYSLGYERGRRDEYVCTFDEWSRYWAGRKRPARPPDRSAEARLKGRL